MRGAIEETPMYWRCIVSTNVSMSSFQVLALALGSVGVTVSTQAVRFVTHHSFCNRCHRSIKRKSILALLCKAACSVVMMVSIIALVYSTLMLALYSSQNPRDIGTLTPIAIGSAITVTLCFVTIQAADYWPVRRPFHHLGKRPFIFDGFEPSLDE